MFTGIVEELGTLERLEWRGAGAVMAVRGPTVAADAAAGDSIAVDGVCLTVVTVAEGGTFEVDVMKETFDRSALGSLAPGDLVNLERAATPTSRLGGHLVQGHVDGVGTVRSRQPGDRWHDVTVAVPPELARYLVTKGSVAVSGVSLTVVEVTERQRGGTAPEDAFTVSLIPTTLEQTTLGRLAVGALVNIEVDVIAKYVEKFVTEGRR